MGRYLYICAVLLVLPLFPREALSQPEQSLRTNYTTIYYDNHNDLDDFIWRLGGQRLDFSLDISPATNRVDRIVERVQAILDMRPDNFRVDIRLHRGPLEGENRIAYYESRPRVIHISVDYATDGVLAHEIAHAVVIRYFSTPPPQKIQEILTQYVDKYLWSDY